MRIVVCPKCYENKKLVEARFLNSSHINMFGKHTYTNVYHCDDCKKSFNLDREPNLNDVLNANIDEKLEEIISLLNKSV